MIDIQNINKSYPAFILAAGLGTRLQTYTRDTPKALVVIHGKPMLEWLILKMKQQGIRKIIVNAHHFADKIINFLDSNQNFGLDIFISDEREQLLDTGGAILKAQPLLIGAPFFLVHNVDIVSDLQFSTLVDVHLQSGALATLAVRERPTDRKFLFDSNHRLCGWKNAKTNETIILAENQALTELAFSGIHVLQHSIFSKIRQTGAFSITNTYLDIAKDYFINAYRHDSGYWFDIGKPEQLQQMEQQTLSAMMGATKKQRK